MLICCTILTHLTHYSLRKIVNNYNACKFWQPQMPIESSKRAQQSFSPEFRARILQVYYSLFSELQDRRIICGAIMAGRGWVEGTATGGTSPPVFRLCPNASRYTIVQELTHPVQGNGSGIPHGEVACDIWIISRLPVELLDQRLYYLLARRHSRLDWKKNRAAVRELSACRL
jgi:hypothetical protein